jgi:hypothetical protein
MGFGALGPRRGAMAAGANCRTVGKLWQRAFQSREPRLSGAVAPSLILLFTIT